MIQIELDAAQTIQLEAAAHDEGITVHAFIVRAIRNEADRTIPRASDEEMATFLQNSIDLARARTVGGSFILRTLVGHTAWWITANRTDRKSLGTLFRAAMRESGVAEWNEKDDAHAARYIRS